MTVKPIQKRRRVVSLEMLQERLQINDYLRLQIALRHLSPATAPSRRRSN
jgi:hypothetical protein